MKARDVIKKLQKNGIYLGSTYSLSIEEAVKRAEDNESLALTQLKSLLKERMPGKMYDPTMVCQPDYPDDYTKGKCYGRNQALSEVHKIIDEVYGEEE